MLNVAMISKWHVHAGGYAKFIQKKRCAISNFKITTAFKICIGKGTSYMPEKGTFRKGFNNCRKTH